MVTIAVRMKTAAAGTGIALFLLAGCGRSGRSSSRSTTVRAARAAATDAVAAKPTPASIACTPQAHAVLARYLAISTSQIAAAGAMGNNAMPQCTFTAHLAKHKRFSVIANVDNGPSPYFRLERTDVESAQSFTVNRLFPPPRPVPGLGIEADWFPTGTDLMSTDGKRLITVTVNWSGARQAREISLAKELSEPYLQKLTAKQAQRLAQGYASG